jgi:ribosomal protein S27E
VSVATEAPIVHRYVKCSNCGRTLGQIVGVRLVVIISGRIVTFPLIVGLELTCPKCGHVSVVDSL